jgi:hypothetical protein
MEQISRKKFLRTVGSIVAGGTVVGVSGVMLRKSMASSRLAPSPSTADSAAASESGFVSPYKQIATFAAQGDIRAFEQYGGRLYVAAANAVSVTDDYGKLLHRFPAGEGVIRDMAVRAEGVYLLRPAAVQVYSHEGALVREWEACSELSDYCSFTLAEDFVFVTDRENKNVCKYTTAGQFVRFIGSPNRFIIPSLTFGIEYVNNRLYCSNSGRHQIETYTLDGEYLGAFGTPGGAPGTFCGCCNPVHLACTPTGEVITSEKGNPRISCYGGDGAFRSMLLDSRALGGGHAAYDVKVLDDRLFVAGKDRVSVFRYDEMLASVSASACAGCAMDCALLRPARPA